MFGVFGNCGISTKINFCGFGKFGCKTFVCNYGSECDGVNYSVRTQLAYLSVKTRSGCGGGGWLGIIQSEKIQRTAPLKPPNYVQFVETKHSGLNTKLG